MTSAHTGGTFAIFLILSSLTENCKGDDDDADDDDDD